MRRYHIRRSMIWEEGDKKTINTFTSKYSGNICDPLSKNPAHPAFYENRDKTGNWYIDVQLCSSEKMEAIGCLVHKLRSETHRGRGMQVFEKTQTFLCCYGKM